MRRAFRARQHDAADAAIILAWQIERVRIMAMQKDGGKKLPSLKALLNEGKRRGKQTPEEQKALLYGMSAALGVPVQRLTRGPQGQWIPSN